MDSDLVFYVRVWQMRQHQIAYYRLRKPSDLIDAKRLEKSVDEELGKRLIIVSGEPKPRLDTPADVRPTVEPKQETLFIGDDNEATKDQ